MKYTSVISLFLASVAVADLPYGMPEGKREFAPEELPPKHWTGTWGGEHPTGPPTGGWSGPTGTGGQHPTGTGGLPGPTGIGGGYGGQGPPPQWTKGEGNHPVRHIKEQASKPTTLETKTGHKTGHSGHGTGGPSGTGGQHPTGTGGCGRPTGTGGAIPGDKPSEGWHKPIQPPVITAV
ncbi:hypothetical protein BKA67DRAFT_536996 [Truncatella angustata]|uniref:Uncharacterized protein n=1 Tax=Truncatella angustata TaxID=152316 RepID=A0A9P8ZWR7_9PEZI|nr:uncharacterized protein BKA67DRAFT_536996 [Truncatella angustata]KAH6653311.1 hypothetical protein BKA67DRAFT_536996 [Truncatella angustata]KAH8195147.1 hypothetical protein TruAng_010699 [Truncatella angustata]